MHWMDWRWFFLNRFLTQKYANSLYDENHFTIGPPERINIVKWGSIVIVLIKALLLSPWYGWETNGILDHSLLSRCLIIIDLVIQSYFGQKITKNFEHPLAIVPNFPLLNWPIVWSLLTQRSSQLILRQHEVLQPLVSSTAYIDIALCTRSLDFIAII